MKKFRFRLQVVLDMREKELEERQMEMARIVTALNTQQEKLQNIFQRQKENTLMQETLAAAENLDIFQLEEHRTFGIKLIGDAKNQERIIERKQLEVKEAYQKVETLKKLKEKQEKEFYKEFLHAEMKEIDDITSARFKIG